MILDENNYLWVTDEDLHFVCERGIVPESLKYESGLDYFPKPDNDWKEIYSSPKNIDKFFQKTWEVEAKIEKVLVELAEELNNTNLFWVKSELDPSGCAGASYVFISCFRKNDILAQRHFAAPNDWVYLTLKPPERLKFQISKVAKVAIYGVDKNNNEEISPNKANELSEEIWRESEEYILEKLKENGFYILGKEQLLKPLLFEFDNKNPFHNTILDSNIIAKMRKPMIYDFFYYWVD